MKRITDKVYLLESTKGSYCYLVKAEEMVLIDTGLRFVRGGLLRELKENHIQLGEIKHIILTHGDMDHMGNVKYLEQHTEAKVWAGQKEIPYIMGSKPRARFKKYLTPFIQKPKHVQALNEGDVICGIEVVETPGHTEGHICLVYDDVLFAGDLVEEKEGYSVPYPPSWNWDTSVLFRSIEKMKKYPFKWVCVAHGKTILRDELFEA